MKARITIGIPCFQGVDFQVLDDYMRFAFYLGRRYQEYEFFLAIKGKSEQFRARNSLVDQMLHTDSDYLLMLDDDHVIDFDREFEVDNSFEFLRKLLGHMEKDPKMGIVGALYSQRGKEGVYPVVMSERDGIPYFLSPQEISNTMQNVADLKDPGLKPNMSMEQMFRFVGRQEKLVLLFGVILLLRLGINYWRKKLSFLPK